MATKNISITEDAYRRLAALRKNNESFSEIIISITKKKKMDDFFGILSKKSADAIERAIRESRERHKIARTKRLKKLLRSLTANGLLRQLVCNRLLERQGIC